MCFAIISAGLKYGIMDDITYFVGDPARYLIQARNILDGHGIMNDMIWGYPVPDLFEDHVPIYAFAQPLNAVLLAFFCWITSTDVLHGWILQPLFFSTLNIFLFWAVMKQLMPDTSHNTSSGALISKLDIFVFGPVMRRLMPDMSHKMPSDKISFKIFVCLNPPLILTGLFSFNPRLFDIATTPYSETAFTSILLASFLVLTRLAEDTVNGRRAMIWCCQLGFLCGAAFLQRFHGISFLPAVILSVLLIKGLNKKSVYCISIIGVSFLLSQVPHIILMILHEGDPLLPVKMAKLILFEPRPWQYQAHREGFVWRATSSLIGLWRALDPSYRGSLFKTFGSIVWLALAGFFMMILLPWKGLPQRKLFCSAGLIIFFALWGIAIHPKFYYEYMNYRGTYPYVSFFLIFASIPFVYFRNITIKYVYSIILVLFLITYVKYDCRSNGFIRIKSPPQIHNEIGEYIKLLDFDDTIILSRRADYLSLYSQRKGIFAYPNTTPEGMKAIAKNYNVTHLILTSSDPGYHHSFKHLLKAPESELPNWLELEKEFRVITRHQKQIGRLFKINRAALLQTESYLGGDQSNVSFIEKEME